MYNPTYVDDAPRTLVKRHLFRNAEDAVVDAGAVVLLNGEGNLAQANVQTAFDGPNDIKIEGGFFGIHAPDNAINFIRPLSKGQLKSDSENSSVITGPSNYALVMNQNLLLMDQHRPSTHQRHSLFPRQPLNIDMAVSGSLGGDS